jgi:hypothetical protein
MPEGVLYGIIGALAAAIVALAGLWVRAHDVHRQWSTERINEHTKDIAVMRSDVSAIADNVREVKDLLHAHDKREMRLHDVIVSKFGLSVDEG